MLLLKILLWLLLAIVILLLLALVLPAAITIHYENGGLRTLKARLLFIIVDLQNPPKFFKKKKKQAPAETAKEPAPKKSILDKIRELNVELSVVPALFEPTGVLLRKLVSTINITDIDLLVTAGGKSPEAVGANTGRVWAVIGGVMGALGNIFRLRVKNITVLPDFSHSHGGELRLAAKAKGSLLAIGVAALTFLIKAKKIYNDHKKTTPTTDEEGVNNEQQQ